MRDAAALWFLERRQTANRIKLIFRSPGRAAFYAFAVLYFAFLGFLRSARVHGAPSLPEPFAGAAFFAFITLLGVVAYGAAGGLSGAFASPADARFLAGSLLDQRIVVFWLQLRRTATTMLRMLVTILLYAMLSVRSPGILGVALTVLGASAASTAVSVPMLQVRKKLGPAVAKGIAGAIAAIGIFNMLAVLSGVFTPNAVANGVQHLGTGIFANALFASNPIAQAILWAFAAALVALAWFSGNDLYPELYAASLKAMSLRERARGGASAAFKIQHAYKYTAPAKRWSFFAGFRGAWAAAWKEWTGFMRSPSLQRLFFAGLAGMTLAGWILGTLTSHSARAAEESYAFAPAAYITYIMFVAMGSAVTLGADLGKPLWWMGPDALRTRLWAWIAATSWRSALVLYAGIAAWAIAARVPAALLYGLPLAAATVAQLRAVGLTIYSMFPSTIDQRGPMGAVRALLTYVFSLPPIAVATVCMIFGHSAALAVAAAVGTEMLEVSTLVVFSASRIAGSGAAFARAEGA